MLSGFDSNELQQEDNSNNILHVEPNPNSSSSSRLCIRPPGTWNLFGALSLVPSPLPFVPSPAAASPLFFHVPTPLPLFPSPVVTPPLLCTVPSHLPGFPSPVVASPLVLLVVLVGTRGRAIRICSPAFNISIGTSSSAIYCS